jgi:hypothetical protein
MYFLGMRANGADDFVAFALEAVLSCLLLSAVYVYWRQLTSLAVHFLCVALSWLIMLGNPDVIVRAEHFALATLGRCCWAATLISFPVSLVLLTLTAVSGHQVEPLTNRLTRDDVMRANSQARP